MLDDNKDFRKVTENFTLKDFIFIKRLGSGQFGSVLLVQEIKSCKFYALKVISKSLISENQLKRHTLQEKEVLETINFSFLSRMYRTFKDESNVYFLLQYVQGMELFDVIRELGKLNSLRSPQ